MVVLAVESGGGGSELTYNLTKDVISIGAASDNDVVVRAPGVAPRHLVIQRNGRVFTFLAQQRQVVVLNGERRSRGVLRVGDRMRLGTAAVAFRGTEGEEPEELSVAKASDDDSAAPSPAPSGGGSKARSEFLLYNESDTVAVARQQLVEMFRCGVRADPVPGVRSFFERFFPERQAMLAVLDDRGSFQAVASQWSEELPKLPARTFDELKGSGRYGVLRHGSQRIVVYPVRRSSELPLGYLLLEVGEDLEDDEALLSVLSDFLAANWERVSRSEALDGQWLSAARQEIERRIPGTSNGIRVLRDGLVRALGSAEPVMVCGRPGTGRTWVATLAASLGPQSDRTVEVFHGRDGDPEALRQELFGQGAAGGETDDGGAVGRAGDGTLVVREVHLLPWTVQREIAVAVRHGLDQPWRSSVRWMFTTGDEPLALVNDGSIESSLFNLCQHHLLRVPSLEERREDLPLLTVHLLDELAAEQDKRIRGIELETLNCLLHHPFEGQVGELLTELRRLVSATPNGEMVRGTIPASEGATPAGPAGSELLGEDDLKIVIPGIERLVIDRVLRNTKGNQSRAARVLNISRGALIAKIKEYDVPDYRYLRRQRS